MKKYKGDAKLQKTYIKDYLTKKKCVNHGEIESYYIENNHPPIISREMWEEAQQQIILRGKAKGHTLDNKDQYTNRYPLTGKLLCSKCGATLRRRVWNSKYSCKKVMWQCSTYIQEGKNSCSGTTIEDDEIGRMNIQKETLVEEVFKNGKKYCRYTSKSEPVKFSRKPKSYRKNEQQRIAPGIDRSGRAVIKLQSLVKYYTAYIEGNPEYECAGIYADEGISGTNTKKREQFNRMIEDCKARKIDMVITKSISRFIEIPWIL